MRFELWHAFVLGTILSWGAYIAVLHEGQAQLGGGNPSAGSLRAFLCVGIAYLIIAVIVPLVLFFADATGGEPLSFTAADGSVKWGGLAFATLGGIAGAAGALCIILALKNGGTPLYVAPLVFAGAPIVNTIVSLVWKTHRLPGSLFFLGIVLAAAGASLVVYSKADLDKKLREEQARLRAVAAGSAPSITSPKL
jgi:uncharacterized membrane protein